MAGLLERPPVWGLALWAAEREVRAADWRRWPPSEEVEALSALLPISSSLPPGVSRGWRTTDKPCCAAGRRGWRHAGRRSLAVRPCSNYSGVTRKHSVPRVTP